MLLDHRVHPASPRFPLVDSYAAARVSVLLLLDGVPLPPTEETFKH